MKKSPPLHRIEPLSPVIILTEASLTVLIYVRSVQLQEINSTHDASEAAMFKCTVCEDKRQFGNYTRTDCFNTVRMFCLPSLSFSFFVSHEREFDGYSLNPAGTGTIKHVTMIYCVQIAAHCKENTGFQAMGGASWCLHTHQGSSTSFKGSKKLFHTHTHEDGYLLGCCVI